MLKVLDTETGIMITEDKFYLVEGRVLTTSRKTERYFKPVKCIR